MLLSPLNLQKKYQADCEHGKRKNWRNRQKKV